MRVTEPRLLSGLFSIYTGADMFRKNEVYGNRITLVVYYAHGIYAGLCNIYKFRNCINLWNLAKAFRFKVVNRAIFCLGGLYYD